jgi:hypothetical protein
MSRDQQILSPQASPPQQSGAEVKQSNVPAVTGFVFALLGFVLAFIPVYNIFGCSLALVGLISGIIGLIKSGERKAGKGLSIAAVILAVAAFLITVVVDVVVLKVLDSKVSAISEALTVAAPVTGKTGQTVKDGDFTFVVKSVKCGMTTSGGPVPSKATEEFCAVDLSVTNGGKDVNTFDDSQVEGFSAGRRHVANSEATMRANTYTNVFPKVVQPGQVLRSVVAAGHGGAARLHPHRRHLGLRQVRQSGVNVIVAHQPGARSPNEEATSWPKALCPGPPRSLGCTTCRTSRAWLRSSRRRPCPGRFCRPKAQESCSSRSTPAKS